MTVIDYFFLFKNFHAHIQLISMQAQNNAQDGSYLLSFSYVDLLNYILVDNRLKIHENVIWISKVEMEIQNGCDCSQWYREGYTEMVKAHMSQEQDKDTLRECAYAAVDGNQQHILELIVKSYRK